MGLWYDDGQSYDVEIGGKAMMILPKKIRGMGR